MAYQTNDGVVRDDSEYGKDDNPYDQYSKKAAARNANNKVHVEGEYQNTVDSPGAADYGGGPDMAKYYKEDALSHRGDNDNLQASNSGAMAAALKNMRGGRGPQTYEDPSLVMRANNTRAAQIDSLGLQRNAALGGAPSEADASVRVGLNNVGASRAGSLGAARGLSALGGAQGASAASASDAAGGIGTAGGMARSKEIVDATGMYGSSAGAVRQADFNRLGISDDLAMKNANNDLNWRLGNAQLAASQGGLGVALGQTDAAWMGQAMSPEDRQFQYDQEMAAAMNGANTDAAAARITRNRESKEAARSVVNGTVQAGLTGIGSLAGPEGAAAGSAAGGMFSSSTSKYW